MLEQKLERTQNCTLEIKETDSTLYSFTKTEEGIDVEKYFQYKKDGEDVVIVRTDKHSFIEYDSMLEFYDNFQHFPTDSLNRIGALYKGEKMYLNQVKHK